MNHNKKTGFTLVELMLAMSFLSVLLLGIAMSVIQISNIYTHGLTLKEVNQTGRQISNELKHGISQSAPFAAPGTKYISQPWGGRLCVGQFSYIWNYGSVLNDSTADGSNSNIYSDSVSKIRFVKVLDNSGEYCKTPSKPIVSVGASELLASGDRDLAIHSFSLTASSLDARSGQGIYAISYVIGTNDQAALNPTATSCRAPSELTSDINYCSINQFDIVVRATNALE
jgi:hypothetical protein